METPRPQSVDTALREKFNRLAAQWRSETGHLSNVTKRLTHPAYLKIVAMGPAAISVLLAELRRAPGHWGTALYLITEANPVDPRDAGDLEAIRAAWLRWGTEHGYSVDR